MTQVLDYGARQRWGAKWRVGERFLATLPLIIALIAYFAVCRQVIAHQQRYPGLDPIWAEPPDPIWTGLAFLWPLPVPLFVLCWPGGRFAKAALLLYAAATALLDASTIMEMPAMVFSLGVRPVSFSWTLQMAVTVLPFHLIVICALAIASRLVSNRLDQPYASHSPRELVRARIIILSAMFFIAAAIPPTYCAAWRAKMKAHGRTRADEDWASQTALYLLGFDPEDAHTCDGAMIDNQFDAQSGLLKMRGGKSTAGSAYKERIAELVKKHGPATWSQKRHLVSDEELVAVFSNKRMSEVTSFPLDIAPGVSLLKPQAAGWVGLATSHSGGLTFCWCQGPLCVARLDNHPGVVFIRISNCGVIALTDDGWMLETAHRVK